MKKNQWLVLSLALASSMVWGQAAYDLPTLERLAINSNRAILSAHEQINAARAAVTTAAAFPNPELEYLAGTVRSRGSGIPGDAKSVMLTQPLDFPWLRTARIDAALAGQTEVQAGVDVFIADSLALVRLRYYESLRREAELKNAREDAELMEGVRSRIAWRVETGESARFELIKAEAEVLNALKAVQAAGFRTLQAKALLRQSVGDSLPEDFVLKGSLTQVPDIESLGDSRGRMVQANPDLLKKRAELQRAERMFELEKVKRLPTLSLKAGREEDPEVRTSRVGVAITIPLWDRRAGPVAEAQANVARARYALEAQEFSGGQALASAYQIYGIARAQVVALESGIVKKAEAALKVSEAAYRAGERGFLEVIDAQRVYRAARAELITARFELASAWIDIERLRASSKGMAE